MGPRSGQLNLGRPFKAGKACDRQDASRQRCLNSPVANATEIVVHHAFQALKGLAKIIQPLRGQGPCGCSL
jgi:hypothetical protein